MAKTKVEGKILTGVGAGYLQFVKTLDTSTEGLTYEPEVYEVYGIDKLAYKPESKTKPIYLSNVKVADFGKFSGAEMTVDYGFFPEGFVEKASGMVKLANGTYVQGENPVYKTFRWAFIVTDSHGGEIIYNFPKCQLEPSSFNAETETDEKKENYQQITIKAYPIIGSDNGAVYTKIDLRENDKYDRSKLLEIGFYNADTLKNCLKDPSTPDDSALPRA